MAGYVQSPSPENLMLGKGGVYFDRKDILTGLFTGERHLGNCDSFSVSTQMEEKKKYSSMEAAARLYKSVMTQLSATGKIQLDEFDPRNVALALFGDTALISQAAATGLTYTVTNAGLGLWYDVDHFQISNVVVTNVTTPTATPTEHVDYEVDALSGRVHFLGEGSGISDKDTITIKFDCAKYDTIAVNVGNTKRIEGRIRFMGDPTTGPRYKASFWNVVIKPTGDTGFITDDWASMTIEFECQDDSKSHPSCPLHQIVQMVA